MLHTAYKKLYLTCFHGVKDAVSLQKQFKARYGTNDYFPLSAIHEARALLKSNIEINQQLKKACTKRIERIKEKIRKENKTLQNWQKKKEKHWMRYASGYGRSVENVIFRQDWICLHRLFWHCTDIKKFFPSFRLRMASIKIVSGIS